MPRGNLRIVLTGPPHSGKTTCLQQLAAAGHMTVPESAKEIIDEDVPSRYWKTDWSSWRSKPGNEIRFQRAVALRQLAKESMLESVTGTVFFDRGLIDGRAYCALKGVPHPLELAAEFIRYDAAFLFEDIGFQERPETGRIDTAGEIAPITALLRKAYSEASIPVVTVPVFADDPDTNIQRRIRSILAVVSKL